MNRAFARQFLGSDRVGQRLPLNLYEHRDWQVVGVIDDVEGGGMDVSAPPAGLAASSAQPEIFNHFLFAHPNFC